MTLREKCSLTLRSLSDNFCLEIPVAHVTKNIMKDIEFSDGLQSYEGDIDVLLGSSRTFEVVQEYSSGLLKTRLGNTFLGNRDLSDCSVMLVSNEQLDRKLEKFWQIETLGLSGEDDKSGEVEASHQRAFDLIREKTVCVDGRYKMPLLFKADADMPKNNVDMALHRFKRLERKFERDPDYARRYRETMNDYISKYASEVPADKIKVSEANYLPHSAVIRDDKTTSKTRIVFDASAKYNGKSMNDRLLAGPPVHPDIVGILLRFRLQRVAVVGDISKMFFQIGLLDEDKRFHRFLWRDNPSDALKHYEMDVTTFGFCDAPVKAIVCIRRHVAKLFECISANESSAELSKIRAAIELLINMFVDDLLSGAKTVDEAFELYVQIVDILAQAGFHIRKFLSNSQELMSRIPEDMRGQCDEVVSLTDNIEDSEQASSSLTKALGVGWDIIKDLLCYNSLVTDEGAAPTKRTISSTTARLFDPLGIVVPFIMSGKILLQQCWREGLDWDEEVPNQLKTDFERFVSQIPQLAQVRIPRCILLPEDYTKIELHVFTDASEKALGACVYAKVFYPDTILTHLLLAKGKVASVKAVTLPKKELCGLVIGAKLVCHAAHELNVDISSIYAHTDSMTAWQWLQKSAEEWKIYVRNRVKIIQDLLPISHVFHVPGVNNPADLVSRGCDVSQLDSFWFEGPEFLQSKQPFCPKPDFDCPMMSKACLEEKRPVKARAMVCALAKTTRLAEIVWAKSNFRTFLNITAFCMRVFSDEKYANVNISDDERMNALLFWIKQSQLDEFTQDYQRLAKDSEISGKSRLRPLTPIFDNVHGVLRVGGRLEEADLDFVQTHPVILSPPTVRCLADINDDIVARLIMSVHVKNTHAGADWTLNHLRISGFWVLNGKSSVQRVVSKCVSCQRAIKAKEKQLMGNLPFYRLQTDLKPFSYVGVDGAGPLYVKDDTKAVTKCYIMLFTCLNTRAVHLELTVSQSTEALYQCIRRMIARRGTVLEFLSDNHRSNVRMGKEMDCLIATAKDSNKDFKWRFIPEHGPWAGGCYERVIGTVKSALRKVLGKTCLSVWELQTVLCEVESFVNDRPLCPVSADVNSMEPITPSMLMTGYPLSSLPSEIPKPASFTDKSEREIIASWKRRVSISRALWARYKKDYLWSLTERRKWTKERENLQVGNLVLLHVENTPRGSWPLARVVETEQVHNLRERKSDKVRSVILRLASGKLTRRPVQHLVKLEVQ